MDLYKIVMAVYLFGASPVDTVEEFTYDERFTSMEKCMATLTELNDNGAYKLIDQFIRDTNFKYDWIEAGCFNQNPGKPQDQKIIKPEYPNGLPKGLKDLENYRINPSI